MTAGARRSCSVNALIRDQGYNIGLNYKQKRCSFCKKPPLLFNSLFDAPRLTTATGDHS